MTQIIPQLSIIVPVYNEDENLETLIAEIHQALAGESDPYEILLVDDCSDDGSAETMQRLARSDHRLRVLRHSRNLGQSAALVSGFSRARGEIFVTLDADLQNDPADIPKMLAELTGSDVVCGVRTKRQDSWIRLLSSRIANGTRNRLTGESIRDVGCSLRVYRHSFLKTLPAFDGMHRFLPTLLKLNGAHVREVPVNHRPRLHGDSKYGIHNRLWRGIADLFGVRWLQRRWIDQRVVEEVTPVPDRRS